MMKYLKEMKNTNSIKTAIQSINIKIKDTLDGNDNRNKNPISFITLFPEEINTMDQLEQINQYLLKRGWKEIGMLQLNEKEWFIKLTY